VQDDASELKVLLRAVRAACAFAGTKACLAGVLSSLAQKLIAASTPCPAQLNVRCSCGSIVDCVWSARR
jgi:hypothetical protein